MTAYTKDAIRNTLNADNTVDKDVIASVIKLLEKCDKRTDGDIRKEVFAHIKQFTANERRTFTEIEKDVNRLWRIEPEKHFCPIALQALKDFAANPSIIGVSVFDKGGKKQYYFNANEK